MRILELEAVQAVILKIVITVQIWMMETLEADLAAEIKKNHNLLRMNKSLMEEN